MHKPELEPKLHPYKMRFGQRPLTVFKDYRKTIKVKLIEPEGKDQMMKRLYQFVRTTWEDDVNDNAEPTIAQMKEGLEAMLSGKALGLGLEATSLTFEISGITRVDLQQIVRQRVGVTFSVQCTGDRDLRHGNMLVEESINQSPEILEEYIKTCLIAKHAYSNMLDSKKVSIQAARVILPECREMHMRMHTNLSTLIFFYTKRIDDSSQTWQMNQIVKKMADAVIEVYPELADVFFKASKKFTMAKNAESDRGSTFATALYLPKEDSYDYHERDYLYNTTKEKFNFTETPIEDTYYWGYEKITKDQYWKIFHNYDGNTKLTDRSHFSNEKIDETNKATTLRLETEI